MKLKRVVIPFMACILSMGSIVAYAATNRGEPSDYYDTIYEGNTIEVGDDISPGEYCLFASKDTSQASYSIKNGSKVLISDSFRYNAIVDLDDEDILYLNNCYAVPYEDARIQPVEECMLKVGDDGQVKPGKYCIRFVRGNSFSGTATVYEGIDFHYDEDDKDNEHEERVYSVSNSGVTKVTLKDGDYVMLNGCRLLGVHEDKDD